MPVTASARDGGREGLSPAKGRQEEWYRRVFASALSLGKEAKRFFAFPKGDVRSVEMPKLWKRNGSRLADSRRQADFMDNGTAQFYGDSRRGGRFAAARRDIHKKKSDCGTPLPEL